MLIGIILLIIGGVVILIEKTGGIPKLPGDILIKTDRVTFYFPIVTSIILSLLLTLLLAILKKLK